MKDENKVKRQKLKGKSRKGDQRSVGSEGRPKADWQPVESGQVGERRGLVRDLSTRV